MILNLIFLLFSSVINVLLSPLTLLDITVDYVASIPIVNQFLQIAAYIIPWNNILPLVIIVIGINVFKILLALIKLIWRFIPIFR